VANHGDTRRNEEMAPPSQGTLSLGRRWTPPRPEERKGLAGHASRSPQSLEERILGNNGEDCMAWNWNGDRSCETSAPVPP
jgi:hypothetical protein